MKFEMSLSTPNLVFASTKEKKEKTLKEGFTCVDVTTICGIDMGEDSAILVSRESWKRLEVFMALLSGVNMSLSKDELNDILGKK